MVLTKSYFIISKCWLDFNGKLPCPELSSVTPFPNFISSTTNVCIQSNYIYMCTNQIYILIIYLCIFRLGDFKCKVITFELALCPICSKPAKNIL